MATTKVDTVKSKNSKKSTSAKANQASSGVDIKKLLEAGAHFGHKTSRWHPKMAPYIHSKRDGNHIIDLTKTVEQLEIALQFLQQTAAAGKQILLVSTKQQVQEPLKAVAETTGMPYVTERWLGGMLTNVATMGRRIKHLKDLENRMANGELAAKYNKLEVQRFQEEIEEMNHLYGGIKEMHAKPGAMFIIDIIAEANAVREARKLNIPVVALVDTNADPNQVTYPIACNDDATKTVTLILDYVKQAIEAGKTKTKEAKVTQTADKTEKTEEKSKEETKAKAAPKAKE